MAGGTVAAFWAVSFLFVITPGADWAYAIAAGLRHRVVLPAVGGLLVGHLTATAVVAAGVGALVARSPLVLTVLTAIGATYLVWLGIGMLAHPAAPQGHTQEPSGSWLRQAAKGAGISGLNPKVFLLFLALLPQFTDPDAAWPIAAACWRERLGENEQNVLPSFRRRCPHGGRIALVDGWIGRFLPSSNRTDA